PMALKRYVNGAEGEFFFQKRAPEARPLWIETVELKFPSGRTAREVVLRDAPQLAWIINLGCIDLHPHPVRADDLDHPDELRVDLDPVPGVPWPQVREVALLAREVLREHGLSGWPKTSGSRGIHVNVRIQRHWTFQQVRAGAQPDDVAGHWRSVVCTRSRRSGARHRRAARGAGNGSHYGQAPAPAPSEGISTRQN